MMESIPESLLVVGESFEQKYKPILDFHGWRVAVLRYFDGVDPASLRRVERHNATNEVFILTEGQADLILFEGGDSPTDRFYVFPMRLNVAYNIQESGWHHVAMSKDAHIILVERTDTTAENSNYAELPPDVIRAVQSKFTVTSSL